MVRRTHIALLAALAATLVASGPAVAQRGSFDQKWDNNQEDRREVPLSSVLRDLRMQYGGRHLDAQKAGGRYIIAWITEDGRRLTIEVDAATGRVLSTR
jgi:uncharacterized membrane protein YkoI